jgi:hypothetical protein
MVRLIPNTLRWFKRTRDTRSPRGYWMHLIGQWVAVCLMVYWWRAMLHLLDTVEAFVAGWRTSTWEGFGFVSGLIAIPVHLVSEPVYFAQLCAITFVCYLTVNRRGYRRSGYVAPVDNASGAFWLSAWMMTRR